MSKTWQIMIGTIAMTGLFWLMAGVQAQGQQAPPIIYQPSPDSPIGVRNPQAPPQTRQVEFLVGDWDVDITWHQPQGGDLVYKAKWHNTWIVDGHALMQEWRGPYATGAELRGFNPQSGKWEGRNFYAGRQTWTESVGEFANDEFVIETTGGVGPQGAFINRERYFDIRPDSFQMRATRSYDGGQTWSEPTYEMVCTRMAGAQP